MARARFLLLVYSVSTSLLLLNNNPCNSNGLTLELIPPKHQESVYLRSNFSYEERVQRLVSQSILHTSYLNRLSPTASKKSTLTHAHIKIARPLVDLQEFNYIVKIGIGTFKSNPPFKEYYLDMDTGSSLTWIQCEGCVKCFKQRPKPFPKNTSTSFHPLLDEDNKPLPYNIIYGDGSNTSGIMAKETLRLQSNTGGFESVQGFVFGCGLVNNMEYGEYKNNRIAGVMGLGGGTNSFVNQISKSMGRFSYCLPVVGLFSKVRPKTYLRFGNDIVQGRNAGSTTITKVEGSGAYYLGMEGISINNERLNISTDVFALKNDGPNGRKGGTIIDSGTPYSRIIAPAYDKLKEGLEVYFSKNKNLQRTVGDLGLDLCYKRRKAEGFKNLPNITFHFQGARAGLVIRPQGGFEVAKRFMCCEYFCLAMLRSKRKSVIGAHQQTNQRIIYDTQKKKLVFHSEDCSKSS